MPRNIAVLPDESRIEVSFIGPVTFADRAQTLTHLAPKVRANAIRMMLVDFSAAWHEPESAEAVARFERFLADFEAIRGTAVAFVNCPGTHSVPTERTAEAMGFAFKRFYGRDTALAWLGTHA